MTQGNQKQISSDFSKLTNNSLQPSQFASLPYFFNYMELLSQKQCRVKAQKAQKYFKLAKIKKGTVLYASEDLAEKGYILLNGCIQLLNKKNSRQKTEMFPNHILHTLQQKQNYLYQNFKIPKNRVQNLVDVFYQQKVLFKFMVFQTLYGRQQFGFGQMVRNSVRQQTAISIQQSQVLIIDKKNFDEHLRDFHYKKQNALISKILKGCSQDLREQIRPKILQIMNTSAMYQYDNESIVYKQNDYSTNIYFVIEGEVQIRKKALLEVPKKYMKHQNKGVLQKQVVIKVNKISKGSYFGQQQIFSGRKFRSYTMIASLNNTLILKIDHTSFLKSIGDFPSIQKQLIQNAVIKKSSTDNSYEKQYKKILNAFLNQYEAYDSKKKQKLLSQFIDKDEKKNQMFEVYAPEGVFFRDTFQKLQGFQQEERSPTKKNQGIRRFKQKIATQAKPHNNIQKKHNFQSPKIQVNNSKLMHQQQIAEKLLFSPKRNIHVAQFYSGGNSKQNDEVINPSSPSPIRIQRKSNSLAQMKQIHKFQQIQKDEAIYKRVLIKNGQYPIDKKIDKSNSVRALVHHNFDQVVKLCIVRKNQSLKRASKEKQDEIVVQNFHRTVESIRNKTTSSSFKFSRFTTPCKGTEQLKKRMLSIHNMGSERLFDMARVRKTSEMTKIEDCMGVNQKPKSSQVPNRSNIQSAFGKTSKFRSPQKVVLLNHMMKPITYFNSTEL